MFGAESSDEEPKSKTLIAEIKPKPQTAIDNIDHINVGKREFYDKLISSSNKTQLVNDITEIIQDGKVVNSKITKRKFLLTKNLNFEKRKKPRSKAYISKRVIKKQELFDLKAEQMSYSALLSLTKKWEDYILDLIKSDKTDQETLMKICKADFHGASISIKESRIKSQIGVVGIVLKDTRNAFTILNSRNKIIIVLKQNCVFSFKFANKTVSIYGPCLVNRVEERNKQKFTFDRILKDIEHLINVFR